MATGILALNINGTLSYCTAPPELRGKGRCNHIAHQEKDESADSFIKRINKLINVDKEFKDADINKIKEKLISKYCNIDNPDWEEVIKSIDNPFCIGKEEDGSYEEAELIDFKEEEINDKEGNRFALKAYYKFRGRIFECDYGEVPQVNNDGTITIDGVNWRVLPVIDQNKAGVISYNDNIVIKQADERNIAIIMSKDPEIDTCKIYGIEVPIDTVQNFLKTGDTTGLTSGQVWALKNIDPIAYERFPNLTEDLRSLKSLEPDKVADIEWRKCRGYKDFVKEQIRLQSRRMGVTFRTNLAARQKNSENPMDESLDSKYPLFYQVNLTDNIKKGLVGRSNVQHADDLNPISALSQAQKISFTGPGGYHKDKVPYELRMPDYSHKNVIDAMDVSSGKNVGLTATLSHGYIDERGFIREKDPKKCLSPSDFIPFKNHNDPNRGIMAVAHMKQACPIVGGMDPTPTGDELSDKAWSKLKGSKLGCEFLTAYISDPDAGNFEDAVVISQSAASKMATIQTHSFKARQPITDVKVGQRVERKQIVNGEEIKYGGVVTRIEGNTFDVETKFTMGVGDKLAGRHGNKSVVAKVLPDDEMPKIFNEKTGKLEHVDIQMSPLSVSGRKNLGQVLECNQSMGDGAVINKKRKAVLNDGHQIECTGGKQYILRLNHIAEKKLASHADELTAKYEAEGSRLGEMESILLSTSPDRLRILNYLRHQEQYDSHKKLHSLCKSIGVDLTGVNWND